MAGKLSIMPENPVIRSHLDKEVIHGWPKDGWRQVPGKIIFGNGTTWTCLISLDLKTTEQGDYLLERMRVQEGILEILRILRTCNPERCWGSGGVLLFDLRDRGEAGARFY